MKTQRQYRSEALGSLHSAMQDLDAIGAIDKTTMRRFDLSCLTQVDDLEPAEIKKIREEARMSQATFALALNVKSQVVSKWERGEKKPSGPSLKLLALARRKGIEAIL